MISFLARRSCPAGTYSASSAGSLSCDRSPAGSYSSSAGSTAYQLCPAGTYSSASSLSSSFARALSSNLQLYYRFDAVSVSGSSSSVGNIASGAAVYDAALYNGATVSNNQLLLSAAKSQYMSISPFTTGSAGLTFATWWRSTYTGSWSRIFDFGNGATSDNIQIYRDLNNNLLTMAVFISSQAYVMSTSVRFDQNSWNHVAWSLDPSEIWVVYINGVQLTSSATSKPYPSLISRSNNFLGRSNWGSDYFNGSIKDFRMYSRVLTTVEVSTLFNATQTIFIGATQCTSCSAGQYSSVGSASCSSCAAGSYSSVGSGSCFSCPAGTYSLSSSSVSCDSCPAGSYSSSAGFTSCSQCPARTYSSSSSLSSTVSGAPSSGLQLYYRFDAVSAFYIENVASGSAVYDAMVHNGATVSNNQLLFSSTQSQYMSIDAFITATAGLTFATWWKSVDTGYWAGIFDFGNGAPADNILLCCDPSAKTLAMYVYISATEYLMSTSVSCFQNSWNHVAWTLDSSGTWVAYINGVQVTSESKVYPRSVSRSNNYLGKANWAGEYLNGAIKDFRMYNRVLSAVEVSTLFNATQTIFIGPTKCSNCSTGQYSSAGSASCLIYPTTAPIYLPSWNPSVAPTLSPIMPTCSPTGSPTSGMLSCDVTVWYMYC